MDPAGGQWELGHELLATIAELVDLGNRMFMQANTKEGTRLPTPLRIPRPYPERAPAPKPLSTIDEQKAFFEKVVVKEVSNDGG